MGERRRVRVWYESHTPDGKLWCGSSDPDEVVRLSRGRACTFRKIVTYEQDEIQPWPGAGKQAV